VPLEALGAEPFRKKSFCIKQVLCKAQLSLDEQLSIFLLPKGDCPIERESPLTSLTRFLRCRENRQRTIREIVHDLYPSIALQLPMVGGY